MKFSGIILGIATVFFTSPQILRASEPTAAELVNAAHRVEAQGYLNLAAQYYLHALEQEPDQPEVERALALDLEEAGDSALALKHWEILLNFKQDSQAETHVAALEAAQDSPGESSGGILATVPLPHRSDTPLAQGLAAWIDGQPRDWAKILNNYNLSAPRSQSVKYLFPSAGSIIIHNGQVTLQWDLGQADILADSVLGDARVYPALQGMSLGAGQVKAAEWARVGKEIGEKISADDRLAGVQFDIEPQVDGLDALYAAVKNNTTKPVGAAVKVWKANTFKFADFLVLLSYDLGNTPDQYSSAVRDQVRAFLRDARNSGGKAFIGVPAIATHHEYESVADSPDGPRKSSGYTMSSYVSALMGAVGESVEDNDPSYLGLCIWALHPDGGLHGPLDERWYFPSAMDPKFWDLFKLPLAAGRT